METQNSNNNSLVRNNQPSGNLIKIDLLKARKAVLLQEKENIDKKLEDIDHEMEEFLPNALKKLKVRSREDIARDEANLLKLELASSRSIHGFLSEDQKMRVLMIADALGPTETVKVTGVSEQNIYRWRREGCIRKKGSGRPVSYPEFDEELKTYIIEQRSKGISLSTKRFIRYARALAKQRNYDKVKFSRGWFDKFKKRNNISIRRKSTTHYKNLETVKESVEKFRKEIYDMIYSSSSVYDHNHVINVDECGVPRDAPPRTTLEPKGSKHVTVLTGNKEKQNTTVIPAISLSGKRLDTIIILKGKGVKQLKCTIPHDFYISYNEESSWINTKIMLSWVSFVLEPHAKKLPQDKKGLLLMDNHRCHIDEGVLKRIRDLRYDIKLLPPNTTGLLQPLDIGYNKVFKEKYNENGKVGWKKKLFQIRRMKT